MPLWSPELGLIFTLALALTKPPRGLYRFTLSEHLSEDTRHLIAGVLLEHLRLAGYDIVKDGAYRGSRSAPRIRR